MNLIIPVSKPPVMRLFMMPRIPLESALPRASTSPFINPPKTFAIPAPMVLMMFHIPCSILTKLQLSKAELILSNAEITNPFIPVAASPTPDMLPCIFSNKALNTSHPGAMNLVLINPTKLEIPLKAALITSAMP